MHFVTVTKCFTSDKTLLIH